MCASYTCPDNISCFHVVLLTIQICLGLTAKNEVRFFKWMIVENAFTTRLKLHHEHGEVLRPKRSVHKHLHGDSMNMATRVALHLHLAERRHLRVVKMTKIACPWVP